jgi:hypothetical protein
MGHGVERPSVIGFSTVPSMTVDRAAVSVTVVPTTTVSVRTVDSAVSDLVAQACSAAAESMRSSYSRTIISSFDHNQIPAPKWGLTIPIPYNNLERTPPRNGEWGRHANRGVHGGVRVYEGFLIGVYGAAARQNCSYTPNYNNSDVSMGPISSCQQSPPPTHNPTSAVGVSPSSVWR